MNWVRGAVGGDTSTYYTCLVVFFAAGGQLFVVEAPVSAEECQLVNQAYPGDRVEDPHRCRVDGLRGGGWPDVGQFLAPETRRA